MDHESCTAPFCHYTDGEVGFAFEYPQSYDKETVKSWGCSVFRQSLEGGSTQVTFASRAEP